jgi:hypothetical protein
MSQAVVNGLSSWEASGGRHDAGRVSPLMGRAAKDGLKMARNLTTACTRPRAWWLSNSFAGPSRRVMPSVRFLLRYGIPSFGYAWAAGVASGI